MAHNSGNTDANWWVYPFNEPGCTATGADCTLKWSAPAKGTFNHQPGIRDMIYNPGFENYNLGLFKDFTFNEALGFQFRAEAYRCASITRTGAASEPIRPTSPRS